MSKETKTLVDKNLKEIDFILERSNEINTYLQSTLSKLRLKNEVLFGLVPKVTDEAHKEEPPAGQIELINRSQNYSFHLLDLIENELEQLDKLV